MEESYILSEFGRLQKSGLALYDENQQIVEHIDGGLRFQFCLTSALAKKPNLQTPNSTTDERRAGSDISTAGFEIGEIGNTHLLIANKFCWANPHFLLLTSDGYRRQYESLDENDLQAIWSVLSTMSTDFLAFFNCGQDGGCSRLHKHMQLIPIPEGTFASFLDSDENVSEPKVPFQWFYHRFNVGDVSLQHLMDVYNELLRQATEVGEGLSKNAHAALPSAACPHNMIMTRRWMIVIPRRRAAINKAVAANALGMLGYIAVAKKEEMDEWIRAGPIDVLKELGVPK
ncbi:Diadenosine 5',5'''-P1,P4-tetraphosphate phosphorylase 2 [Penicillium rolfsii]|nr:Diadenosine 5',5'''-P1,P4-tetraphosphate phosphorylase 2 [Penicillium rolfsii]